MTYGVATAMLTPVMRIKYIIIAAALLLFHLVAHADVTNTIDTVANTLSAANAVSAPFNPYSPLIAGLLAVLKPVAMFLAGMFTHKAGVVTGKDQVK